MSVSPRSGAKRETLNIRIEPRVRSLIDRAAALGREKPDRFCPRRRPPRS